MRRQRDRSRRAQDGRRISPHVVQQILDGPFSRRQGRHQAPLPVKAMGDVLIQFLRNRFDEGTVSGSQDREPTAAQALEPLQIARQRSGIGEYEHAALTEHRVAAQSHLTTDKGHVIGCMARCRKRRQRAKPGALEQRHINLSPRPGELGLWKPGPDGGNRLGVILVIVGQRDSAEAAAPLDLLEQSLDVLVERRAGVDQPGRIPPHEPRVRAAEREWTWVPRTNSDNVATGQLHPCHGRRMTAGRAPSQPPACEAGVARLLDPMAEPTPPDSLSPAGLEIGVVRGADAITLVLSGELDIASAPSLEQALEDVGASIPRRLVIDLTEVTFMDSTGLRALLLARQRTQAAQQELVLRPGPRQVQRVFELSGTIERFAFEDPPAAA